MKNLIIFISMIFISNSSFAKVMCGITRNKGEEIVYEWKETKKDREIIHRPVGENALGISILHPDQKRLQVKVQDLITEEIMLDEIVKMNISSYGLVYFEAGHNDKWQFFCRYVDSPYW